MVDPDYQVGEAAVKNHAFRIDVEENYDVKRYWVIAENRTMAMVHFKTMPGLSARWARLQGKGQIPDAVAIGELGLDLSKAGTYGLL